MMKIYWRLLGYARPISKFAVPYAFYTLFHSIFNVFNFMMLIPVLNAIFKVDGEVAQVVSKPEFSFSIGYLKDLLSWTIIKYYGTDYNIMNVLVVVAIILVFSALLSNLFRYLGQRTMENMRIKTLQNLRDDVFANVTRLNVGFFSGERKGDVISKITSDVEVIRYTVSSTLQAVFRDPFLVVTYILAMVAISWQLTIFSVLFLPVVALLIGGITKRLRRKATAGQERFADMVSTVDETVSGIKIIKAYNGEGYVADKFTHINRLYSRIMRSMARRQQLASPMSEFLGIGALCVMLMFGGKLVISDSLGAAEFLAFLAIFSQITRPLRSFADAFANVNQGVAAGERVLALLDTKSDITDKPDAIKLEGVKEGIRFEGVHFSYGTNEVIHGIDLEIGKGETVALVGMSGGGKSTISDLIPRFYDVRQGRITVDGVDVRDYTLESLHANIGVVAQETVLFNDTIEGNIRMGKRDATKEEIVAAARVANAHDFILATEEGYQTNIGDRGMKLSGGQRQRLSIARAVLKDPQILILDEATSALDTESEKLVQGALESLLRGRTSLVIAHRLSTIRNADRIYVIEGGVVVEQGTHEELTAKGGVYKRLVDMQHVS